MTTILEKIKRLFQLAECNPSENEAASALALARRLLQLHNLSESSLELDDRETVAPSNAGESAIDFDGKFSAWVWKLALLIANFFDVDYYRSGYWKQTSTTAGYKKIYTIVFYGILVNSQAATTSFASVVIQINDMARRHQEKGAIAKMEYRNGILAGLTSRFKNLKAEEASSCTAIALYGKEVSRRWLAQKDIKIRAAGFNYANYSTRSESYYQGVADSDRVNLNPALASAKK